MGGKSANKAGYFDKLKGLLEEHNSIFIVEIDNVTSQQMHEIRHALRGKGVVLMGKNTMVRTQTPVAIRRAGPNRNLRVTKLASFNAKGKLTCLPSTGSSCSQDFHPRYPRVRASPALCSRQRRFRLHQR